MTTLWQLAKQLGATFKFGDSNFSYVFLYTSQEFNVQKHEFARGTKLKSRQILRLRRYLT